MFAFTGPNCAKPYRNCWRSRMKYASLPILFLTACLQLQAGEGPVPLADKPDAPPTVPVKTDTPPKDVTPLIIKAREQWNQAKQIEERIRKSKPEDDYIKLLGQLEATYQKAVDIYTQAMRESPQNPIVLSDLGRLSLARHDLVQARKFLASSVTTDEAAKILTAVERADIHRTLGGLLERTGVIHVALQHYKRAFTLNGTDVRNRLSLAIAQCASGSAHEAADLLRSFCETLPARETQTPVQQNVSALAQYTLALALEEIGQPEDALTNYQAAYERCSAPEKAENWGVLERSEAAVARLEDAFDAMAELKKNRDIENKKREELKKPLLPDERENYATAARWVGEGLKIRNEAMADKLFLEALASARVSGGEPTREALAKTENWETFLIGMDFFQRAATIFPRFGRAYYELAASNVMLGRYGAARKLLEEAVACSPNNIATLNLYGEVLLQLGQWSEAQKTFKRLRAIEPESARANLGWAQATGGLKNDAKQVSQAIDALDRAEQLGVTDDSLRTELVAAADELKAGRRRDPPKIRAKKNRNTDDPQQPKLPDFWRGSIWDR